MHNIYFDTPDQLLRLQQSALRLRRVGGDDDSAQWLQTLKTGKRALSALSSRGEWETPVAGPRLERATLDAAAWKRVDPGGTVFDALQPIFMTDFARTVWLVRRRDGSVVEVALDVGRVVGDDRSSAICELELELKTGPVSALFDIAADIAASVAVLSLAMSKAQRGYALASNSIDAPTKASPPVLWRGMTLHDTARAVLREMFGHFTCNLVALRQSDGPEVVHQARVAWRRFRSARRLFKPVLVGADMPSFEPLDPLLAKRTRYSIEALRDVLPRHITRKWYRQAVDTQKAIGSDRDLQQAIDLLGRLAAPDAIVAFLRGVAVGRSSQPPDLAAD